MRSRVNPWLYCYKIVEFGTVCARFTTGGMPGAASPTTHNTPTSGGSSVLLDNTEDTIMGFLFLNGNCLMLSSEGATAPSHPPPFAISPPRGRGAALTWRRPGSSPGRGSRDAARARAPAGALPSRRCRAANPGVPRAAWGRRHPAGELRGPCPPHREAGSGKRRRRGRRRGRGRGGGRPTAMPARSP